MRARWIRTSLLAGLSVMAAPVIVTAETAREVLETALERNDARLKGIENFTVVQELMGFEVAVRYETQLVNRHLVAVAQDVAGESEDATATLYNAIPEIMERARLEGTDTVDGLECWILRVDDASELDLAPDMGDATAAFTPESMLFYLDQKNYLLRKIRIEGEAEQEGRAVPLSMEMISGDFRTVDGLVYPFEMTMVVHGLGSTMSAEDAEKARQALADLKTQMAEMPAEQRKMMESMMGDRIQKMEEMASSGEMTTTLTVKEIRVNEPAP